MTAVTQRRDNSKARQRWRLLGLSFLMLFLELALIRWLGANVLYLSYFSNLILLGSFLGIGLGFLSADREPPWVSRLPWTLLVLVGLVMAFPIEINRSSSDAIFFGDPEPQGLPIWLVVPVIFMLVVAAMAMIAQEVARAFAKLSHLTAYAWDIAGSLLGIIVFAGLSYLRAPPVAWAVVVVVGLQALVPRWRGPDRLALLGVGVLLGVQSILPGLSWSPYYQVKTAEVDSRVQLAVNGIPHQTIFPVSYTTGSLYDLPYDFLVDSPERVLIVGAGSGNDVALALSNGAGQVDAVEIDPMIYEIGARLHPDHPYADPRVHVTIDDGRAFIQRSPPVYDLVIFALPDSLTLLSGQANLRLESYLFTVEALEQVRDILRPDGSFVMYNFYREDWLIERLGRTVFAAFGQPPCVVSTGDESRLALLAIGPRASSDCPGAVAESPSGPTPATDDYPFLYVRSRGIPGLYLVTLGLIVAVSLLAIRTSVSAFSALRPYMDLFALGSAFLLLETKSVVQFALWFGTTWFVNALVFAGILVSVLAAVLIARRTRLPNPLVLYGFLFATLAVAWAVDPGSLLTMPTTYRWIAATALTFSPVFVANLIFAQRFSQTASATAAFGANLLGAMLGGVLEYAALIVGNRALIVLAALLYAAALVLRPRAVS